LDYFCGSRNSKSEWVENRKIFLTIETIFAY